MKPYFEDHKAGIKIYHGDAREILPTLEPCAVLVSDPPYGIAHPTDYAARGRGNLAPCKNYPIVYGDAEPFDPRWLLPLYFDKPMVLWGAQNYASRLPDFGGWLVWDKERPDSLDQATCELAWTNCIKGVRRFRHMWNGMLRASENEPLSHPTQKPVALLKWVLSLPWIPDGSVCDPYIGSGTTLRAAKDLGRQAIGIEIEERYCEIAANRLRQEVLNFEASA